MSVDRMSKTDFLELIESCIIKRNTTSQFKESLSCKNYLELEELRRTNNKFREDTDRLLKDLPEVCKYSFDVHTWEEYQDYSLWEIYSIDYSSGVPMDMEIIASDTDGEVIGWIVLSKDLGSKVPKTIWGIKFGSFNPDSVSIKNTEFFRQILRYMDDHLSEYNRVYWIADLSYPFVRHYINIIKKYKGSVKKG